jgi:hypothetical protein
LAPQPIFAGVVAAFTIKLVQITRDLWVVTKESADAARKAADAADLSAHAALGMELPIVRATRPADLLMLDKPVPVDKPYGGIVADHFPSQYSAVSAIYFRNDGRTPAFPLQMQVGYRALEKLPPGARPIIGLSFLRVTQLSSRSLARTPFMRKCIMASI